VVGVVGVVGVVVVVLLLPPPHPLNKTPSKKITLPIGPCARIPSLRPGKKRPSRPSRRNHQSTVRFLESNEVARIINHR
jgi:hypothetical protein